MAKLPETLKNRLHLRKAGVWAGLAWQRARRSEPGTQPVVEAANRALDELAAINKSELTESDAPAYSEAAIRVGASRWAAEVVGNSAARPGKLAVVTTPGQPGETCVHLVDARHDASQPLATRCTYAIVWPASAVANAGGTALTLAVQPLDTWREMWVFRQSMAGWTVDVLPPATETPNLGYVEFAGWVPGEAEVLAAREIKTEGRYRQSFELLSLASLETKKQADKPNNLSAFYRWQDPLWKARTVSLR